MSGGEILQVDPDELRRLGARLGAGAAGVEVLDVWPKMRAASAGIAGADSAEVLRRAGDQFKDVFEEVADRLRGLAETARSNAQSYEDADRFGEARGEN